MSKFTDFLGREWELRITRAHIPKFRDDGFDLNATVKDPNKLDVLTDPEVMGKVLWTLCEKQAEAKSITPEGFAEGFDGPTYFAAQDAFGAAYHDFCHRPAVAKALTEKTLGEMVKKEAFLIEKIQLTVIPIGSNDSLPGTAGSSESKGST